MTVTRAITVESITNTPSAEPFLRRPGLLERIVAAVMLFVYAFSIPSEWFTRVSNSSSGTVEGGSPVTTLVFLSFLGVVWLGFNGNWHIATAAAGREPLLPSLVGLAALSTIWSVNIAETLSTSVVLIITLIVGLYFASRFRLEETLYLAGIALAIGLFINYIFIFVFQEFGVDYINVGTDGGSKWSGVFVTKNELGRIASLSFIVFGFLARMRRSFVFWPALAFLALIQVVASDSATSLGATGGIVALLVVFLGFRGRKTLYGATAVAMVSLFSTLTFLAATNLVVATGLLGKDSNFTGRLPLWQNSFTYGIANHPWLGHGWLAFWSTDRVSFDVQIRTNFDTPHAHNAFIDAWLYVGPLGAVLLLGIFIRGLIWGARNIRAVPTAVGLVPIILISYSLIFSLTEAGVVRRDISFIFFIVACVTAARNKGVRRPFLPDTATRS
jgi:O-antigen ligase